MALEILNSSSAQISFVVGAVAQTGSTLKSNCRNSLRHDERSSRFLRSGSKRCELPLERWIDRLVTLIYLWDKYLVRYLPSRFYNIMRKSIVCM